MLFLSINTAVMLVDFVLIWLLSKRARYLFKIRYPERELVGHHWSETIMAWIKAFILFGCPVVNIICLFAIVFNDENVCEGTINNLYKTSIKKTEEEN